MTTSHLGWKAARLVWAALSASALIGIAARLSGESPIAPDRPAFDEEMKVYKATVASGAVAALDRRLERGETKLLHEPAHGHLLSLLRELKIPVASQLLVASKTSPNKAVISPQNPRALYFNDQVCVAYVPSAELIEVAAADPRLGIVFYTLDQQATGKPRFVRDDRCLECHASSKTLDVPGLMVRSFLTKDDGEVDVLSGLLVNHRTPLADRWGGYYVTGTHGRQTHRGNLFGPEAIARHERDPSFNANVTDLRTFLDVARYPEPGSDLVALMTLEHQAHAQNLLAKLNHDAVAALGTGESLRPAYPAAAAALRYLLFVDEAKLSSPVGGTSDFARQFERQGPKDTQGRSLRQFDLRTRLFKFPCSYMIYSPAFEALPAPARKHLYRRLWDILDGQDRSSEFTRLSPEARREIREILLGTKTDLPAYWHL